jgi:VWFA-related protein
LLLPATLASQVKILMPVVVKDAAGKPVIDLKIPDFHVSGPKNIRVAGIALVSPQGAATEGLMAPVTVIYDAANIATDSFELDVQHLREFLGEVANRRLPVTLLVSTRDGLHLVYSAQSSPDILTAGLAATQPPTARSTAVTVPTNDPKLDDQVKDLKVLNTAGYVSRSRLDAAMDQLDSLLSLAHLVQSLPGRKTLIWVTIASPVSPTQDPAYWSSTTYYPGATFNASMRADKSLLPTYEAMVEQLNAAHVSVYPLYVQGNPEASEVAFHSWMALRQLAESTGGLAFRMGRQKSLLSAVLTVMEDTSSYYMLDVEVPTSKKLDWIPVKVKVTSPGLTVRAAPGFLNLPTKTK